MNYVLDFRVLLVEYTGIAGGHCSSKLLSLLRERETEQRNSRPLYAFCFLLMEVDHGARPRVVSLNDRQETSQQPSEPPLSPLSHPCRPVLEGKEPINKGKCSAASILRLLRRRPMAVSGEGCRRSPDVGERASSRRPGTP